ncbi:MAG: HRDC domain-containing protein [Anaerolineae bacterium]|nr:HRDC domain-containing protein [Anaerolineae bacterium]
MNTTDMLDALMARLVREPIVAVDTESNSLYAYTERVCLIQFSVPGQDYVLDPLAIKDLTALTELFGNANIEKVFHAAEYDVMVLHRDYGFLFENVFDTMIASRIVGWRHYGLGNLLKEHFGIVTDKRMQRTNWGKRPLSPEQLAYAQLDTHFLIPLRNVLLGELTAQQRVEEARAAFARVSASRWNGKEFDPNGFWRIKGARDLDDVGLAVLRALYVYRDRRARSLDQPSFKILNDNVLVTLSEQRPGTLDALSRIKGIPRRLSANNRKRLLAEIDQASKNPPPKKPAKNHNERLSQAAEQRYEALRSWRKARSEARGVEPDVILSNHTLYQLARKNPVSLRKLDAIDVLGVWERREYGQEIVALLRRQQ